MPCRENVRSPGRNSPTQAQYCLRNAAHVLWAKTPVHGYYSIERIEVPHHSFETEFQTTLRRFQLLVRLCTVREYDIWMTHHILRVGTLHINRIVPLNTVHQWVKKGKYILRMRQIQLVREKGKRWWRTGRVARVLAVTIWLCSPPVHDFCSDPGFRAFFRLSRPAIPACRHSYQSHGHIW